MIFLNLKVYFLAILLFITPAAYGFTFDWASIKKSMSTELRFNQVSECIVTTWAIPEDERPSFVNNKKIMGHSVECDGENVTYTHLVSDTNFETPLQLMLSTVSYLNKAKGLIPTKDYSTDSKFIFKLTRP